MDEEEEGLKDKKCEDEGDGEDEKEAVRGRRSSVVCLYVCLFILRSRVRRRREGRG